MVVRKQVNSSRKYSIAQKLVFKTKVPFRALYKATPISYWFQSFPICEGLGRPGIKVKELSARMENIPSAMVLHKHVDGAETRFSTMAVPLVNNIFGKWLGVII